MNEEPPKVFYILGMNSKERFIFDELEKTSKNLAFTYAQLIEKGSFTKPEGDGTIFHDWKIRDYGFSEGDSKIVAFLINQQPINSTVVEMGVWKGWSTSLILPKVRTKPTYYCIDWFKGSPTESCEDANPTIVRELFEKRMIENNLMDKIKIIEGESTNVATSFENESIDLFFLDGAHTEPYYGKDVNAWKDKIRIGGVFSGHDWSVEQNFASKYFDKESWEWLDLPETLFGKHDCYAYKRLK